MENLTEYLFQISIVILSGYLLQLLLGIKKNETRNIPPGPIGLPIVGYLPFITRLPHYKLTELSLKYGKILSLRLGSKLTVVLSDSKLIREVFHRDEFLGRPPNNAISLFSDKSAFFASNLTLWHEQRKFLVKQLKDLGKSKMDTVIQEEISYLLNIIKSRKGEPTDMEHYLTTSMSNNMCSMLFGRRYDYDHPDRRILDKAVAITCRTVIQTSIYIFLPWLKYIPFLREWFNIDKVLRVIKQSNNVIKRIVKEHIATFNPKNIRDFHDSYIVQAKLKQEKGSATTFSEEMLIVNTAELYGAASESVPTYISWCLLIISTFPNVQKKIQQEILDIIGLEGKPTMQDQKSMPYTHSVLLEVMRWKTIVPLNPFRYTVSDTTIGGYDIPKDTIVVANFWKVHHDPDYWKNPDDFMPERFLNETKDSVMKSSHLMPFSIGKRICPGENLANMEAFLYLVSILQKFDVRLPHGIKPTFEADLFITYKLKPHKLCFIPRN